MKVYIKPFCPYCIRLLSLLDQAGLEYEKINILLHPKMGDEMEKLSGQTGVPEVQIANVIIPDYGTEDTLVADIQTILAHGQVDDTIADRLTSVIVKIV